MFHHSVLASSLLLKFMEALYSSFVLVNNHQQLASITPGLGWKSGMNDCQSNGLAPPMIPNKNGIVVQRFHDSQSQVRY